MRIAAFVISLLLLGGAVDPTRGWLIALVVVTGLSATQLHHFRGRVHVDLRLAAFIIAVLLLAGAIDPTKGWLIGLSVVTGLSAFAPHPLSIDLFGFNERATRRWRFDWHNSWMGWDDIEDFNWKRWERRMDRRAGRRSLEDDWP